MIQVENFDTLKMFEQACAFHDIGNSCVIEPTPYKNRRTTHTIAGLVNSVFSCELFMKTIIVYKGICDKPHGHNLYELWMEIKNNDSQLAIKIEESIKSLYGSQNENLFIETLDICKLNFQELRYIYEYPSVKSNFTFIRYLSIALKNVCEDLLKITITTYTKNFKIAYNEMDSEIIKQISVLVDNTYDNIISSFKLDKDVDKFTLYICPDVESFKKYTNKSDDEYEEWMVGNANYTNKKLYILSPNVVHDRTFEDMLKVCRHEVIHIAFEQLRNQDDVNIFIAEGIAVMLAEQISVSALDIENYPSAIKLTNKDYFYENDGYLYSGVYVYYLLKKYGKDTFKKIYMNEGLLENYLYDGFEKEAIESLLNDCNISK